LLGFLLSGLQVVQSGNPTRFSLATETRCHKANNTRRSSQTDIQINQCWLLASILLATGKKLKFIWKKPERKGYYCTPLHLAHLSPEPPKKTL